MDKDTECTIQLNTYDVRIKDWKGAELATLDKRVVDK